VRGNVDSTTDALAHTTAMAYHADNRVVATTYADGTADSMTYDAAGRNVAKTDALGRVTAFAYDALGRLTSVTDALGQSTKYTYDELGHRITQTDANGHVTSFVYDVRGRETKRTLPDGSAELQAFDLAGELTKRTDFIGNATLYSYDALDRTALGLRDRAMLEVFYSSGIRRNELVHLEVFDVDAERGTLFVHHGKGGKERVVPLGERAGRWVEKYREDARPKLLVDAHEVTLFLTQFGEPLDDDYLSTLVARYIDEANLGKKKGSCHTLRHSMATAMLENGADIRHIQVMLGHAKITTTEIYTLVSIRKLIDVHAATHPGARVRPRNTVAKMPEMEPEPTRDELLADLAREVQGEETGLA
jgi:YD repeat-containing protein